MHRSFVLVRQAEVDARAKRIRKVQMNDNYTIHLSVWHQSSEHNHIWIEMVAAGVVFRTALLVETFYDTAAIQSTFDDLDMPGILNDLMAVLKAEAKGVNYTLTMMLIHGNQHIPMLNLVRVMKAEAAGMRGVWDAANPGEAQPDVHELNKWFNSFVAGEISLELLDDDVWGSTIDGLEF